MKMNNKWAVLGWLAAGQLIGKCKQNALETLQIYGATAYLKGVHIVREFFLYQIGVLACIMLLVCGVILIEGALVFSVVAATPASRALALLAMGGVNIAAGLLLLGYFSSSKRWLRKAAKYNAYLEALMEEEPGVYRNCRPRERKVHSRL